ncbi:MAG: helix-turn-helix domain-containing protein [Defluviitaleaceae bacterium]|nr:helix-turn-helix domain-containing protein [Defluviitaleaceae bacterium]
MVGERIRFYRNKKDIYGHDLADLVGLSRHAIMDYENGRTEPVLEDLRKIAIALNVDVDKLYDDYYKFLDYPCCQKIKELRKERGLYQRELAAMLGSDRRTIERWENGRGVIKRKTWEKFRELGLL